MLIILILILLAILAVGLWQKDKIIKVREYMLSYNLGVVDTIKMLPSLWDSYQHSQEYNSDEIMNQLTESKDNVNQVLQDYMVDISRDFTLEEEEKILKGELDPNEVLESIKQESQTPKEQTSETQEEQAPESTGEAASSGSDEQAIVNKYVSELYSCKGNYLGQLGQALAAQDAGTAISLESQCDGQVAGILANMESELQAIGASTEIVNTIRSEYEQEKSLTKSYYMNQYSQYLP